MLTQLKGGFLTICQVDVFISRIYNDVKAVDEK